MINPISPAISLPIISEAVTIDISPTSRFGQPYDVARITTVTRLQTPLQTPQKFLLPKADVFSDPKITLPDGKTLNFTVDAIDAGALEKLKQQLIQETQQFIQNVSTDTLKKAQERLMQIFQLQLMTTAEDIPQGTQLIKFSYTKPIYPENNVYKLESLVPLASFTLQNGGRIHLIIAMPFDPYVPPEKVQGVWVNTSNQQQVLRETLLDNRTILSAFWQQDPQLTITYQY